MAKKDEKYDIPWGAIILMMTPVWPIGLFMLVKNLKNIVPRDAAKKNKKIKSAAMTAGLGAIVLRAVDIISTPWMLFWLLGAAALAWFDSYESKREKRFNRYLNVIGSNHTMSIMSLATAVGVDYNTACDDLNRMLDEKYFPKGAYLDMGAGLYVSSSKYAAEADGKRATARPAQTAGARAQQAAQNAAKKESIDPVEENEYVRWLTQIRHANDIIKDEKLSEQIEQIEQYTANIFECVVERPEKKREISTFMNYYLPTTIKLLNAYGRLEKQKNVEGGNIESSKKDIEEMIGQLVFAFRRQNDQMFHKEALDISSDIKVMETMLVKDGLSGQSASPFAAAVQRKPQ